MRTRARSDDNQQTQMDHFRARGGVAFDTHGVGGGFVDWVGAYHRHVVLVETKNPEQVPSKRRLSQDEHDFWDLWLPHCGADQLVLWETTEDIDRWMEGVG